MLANELLLEGLEPAVGPRIGRPQRLGCGERDVGALRPKVHVGDDAGKDDLCPGWHGGERGWKRGDICSRCKRPTRRTTDKDVGRSELGAGSEAEGHAGYLYALSLGS